jgi:glycosyltransferase involved in cell wall biosynthesis
MKKILFIYDCIYPYQLGGVEKRIYSLSQYVKNDFETHIVGMKKNNTKEKIKDNGVKYHMLTSYTDLYTEDGKRKIGLSVKFAIDIYFFLRKNKFDIIDATANPFFHIFSIRLALLGNKNTTLFTTWHEYWDRDYWIKYSSYLTGSIGFIIQNLALKLSKNIISVSDFTKEKLSKVTRKEITVIPNGIDDIKVKNKRKIYDLAYTGRIINFKNIDKILDLLDINNNLKILITGEGPDLQYLKNRYKSKNIKFAGFIKDQSKLYKYLSSSKIYMMLSEREGFSISTLEAMYLGLPVICYNGNDNGAKDLIVNKKNGILVDLDLHQISKSIDEILKKYTFYSKNSQKLSEKYLNRNIIPIYLNLIKEKSTIE